MQPPESDRDEERRQLTEAASKLAEERGSFRLGDLCVRLGWDMARVRRVYSELIQLSRWSRTAPTRRAN